MYCPVYVANLRVAAKPNIYLFDNIVINNENPPFYNQIVNKYTKNP